MVMRDAVERRSPCVRSRRGYVFVNIRTKESGALMDNDDLLRLRDYIDAVGSSGTTRLPPEPRLSNELGMSRGRLRTLLKRLEGEGLIWRHVGKGTFVGPRNMTTEGVSWSGLVSVDNIIDARLLLEPQLAAQSAIHSTYADLTKLDECIDEMRRTESFAQWKRLDDRLHRTIAVATHNVLLLALFDTLHSHVKLSLEERMRRIYGTSSSQVEHAMSQHVALVEAIKLHDPVAAELAMREHLQSVRSKLFGLP